MGLNEQEPQNEQEHRPAFDERTRQLPAVPRSPADDPTTVLPVVPRPPDPAPPAGPRPPWPGPGPTDRGPRPTRPQPAVPRDPADSPGRSVRPGDQGEADWAPDLRGRQTNEAATGRDHVPGGVRALETVAGLLSSGLLVITVVLLGAKVVAPLVVDGATGPQWWRIGVAAVVAVPGELLRIGRHRRPIWLRGGTAVVVVLAVVGALALTWWW